MTTSKLPGTDAARHGTGEADLTIMYVAHEALRRDLASLVRAASAAGLSDPRKSASVAAGWDMFKTQLLIHHTAEDEVIWPALRGNGDVRLDDVGGRAGPGQGGDGPAAAAAAAAPAAPLGSALREGRAVVTPRPQRAAAWSSD